MYLVSYSGGKILVRWVMKCFRELVRGVMREYDAKEV
jgi:hypothetical protein